jgi:hypothetical protein
MTPTSPPATILNDLILGSHLRALLPPPFAPRMGKLIDLPRAMKFLLGEQQQISSNNLEGNLRSLPPASSSSSSAKLAISLVPRQVKFSAPFLPDAMFDFLPAVIGCECNNNKKKPSRKRIKHSSCSKDHL